MILEPFQAEFMQRALLAGLIVGLLAPLIGSFLVVRRYSLIADCLAHVSLSGVAIGLLTSIHPVLAATGVSSFTALVIEFLRQRKKLLADSLLAMFMWGGLAMALVLISLGEGFNVDLFSYLFGSITTVTQTDLLTMSLLAFLIGGMMLAFYKELFLVALDEELAQVSGVPVRWINFLLILAAAITVSVSMPVVGVLLIGALMVIPVLASLNLDFGFFKTLLFAEVFSILSVVVGLWLSYHFDVASGGAIVLVSIMIFSSTYLFKARTAS